MPKEFNYASEDDFVQRFLIPLLHRLGYSVVANYHRSQGELGKDLVFAEIDRFGHVRYSGLQAKYEASIGLSAIGTVIQDCQQAFASPFEHPHTKVQERIQTFYAVNAGSISEDARTHFFNSIGPPLSACSRLIDGKALIALDRWAAVTQSQSFLPLLNGLRMELLANERFIDFVLPTVEQLHADAIKHTGQWPERIFANRLRTNASSSYLQQPSFVDVISPEGIELYWDLATLTNAFMDNCNGTLNGKSAAALLSDIKVNLGKLKLGGTSIRNAIENAISLLGPLSA